ncbi:hypothetical protein GBAR_LOCUS24841 [Geodia barretti]|uniref:DUF7700 domain-containing protein n=1 Tax=Geodia barretti TaxID=519541 RepID=A0AA35TBD8_GEOBA|nr:hypothetical protein GBAR_LOCUS24841 [Geodia barretti]
MPDQGLCVQVFGKVDDNDVEILRFDCFDQLPHYHYGPANNNIRLNMDKTTVGTPFGWTMGHLRTKLPEMIRRSGYEALADAVAANPVSESTLDEIEAQGRQMAVNQRRTVAHKFERMLEDDVYTVGNLRIGLEYRFAGNSEGLAIHVLSDVADQTVELLAFDCFLNGPHYHYGPRNQDIRIYWDTTTSGETLRWTLDQFYAGNLRGMIERAGYPTIANDVDENLLQATMPAIEKRALELVEENRGGNDPKAALLKEIETLRERVAAL